MIAIEIVRRKIAIVDEVIEDTTMKIHITEVEAGILIVIVCVKKIQDIIKDTINKVRYNYHFIILYQKKIICLLPYFNSFDLIHT